MLEPYAHWYFRNPLPLQQLTRQYDVRAAGHELRDKRLYYPTSGLRLVSVVSHTDSPPVPDAEAFHVCSKLFHGVHLF